MTAIAVVVAGCGGSGETAKSPAAIAADVVAATKQLHSYRMAGTITRDDGVARVTAAVAGPNRIRYVERRPNTLIQVMVLGPVTYLKA